MGQKTRDQIIALIELQVATLPDVKLIFESGYFGAGENAELRSILRQAAGAYLDDKGNPYIKNVDKLADKLIRDRGCGSTGDRPDKEITSLKDLPDAERSDYDDESISNIPDEVSQGIGDEEDGQFEGIAGTAPDPEKIKKNIKGMSDGKSK